MYIHTKLANIHILEYSQLIPNQNRKTFYIGLLYKIPTLELVAEFETGISYAILSFK